MLIQAAPILGSYAVLPFYSVESFDSLWINTNHCKLPASLTKVTQTNYGITFSTSLSKSLSFSSLIGWSKAESTTGIKSEGINDSEFDLTWQLNSEKEAFSQAPDLFLKTGIVIPGTYEKDIATSPGNGFYAIQTSFLISKTVIDHLITLSAELGYRLRKSSVPSESFYYLGARKYFSDSVYFDLMSHGFFSTNGGDLGTGILFSQVHEDAHYLEVKMGYATDDWTVEIMIADTLSGRNTADKIIYGLQGIFNI